MILCLYVMCVCVCVWERERESERWLLLIKKITKSQDKKECPSKYIKMLKG